MSNKRVNVFIFLHMNINDMCVCMSAQLFPTLCSPMTVAQPDSFVHGLFQARILE